MPGVKSASLSADRADSTASEFVRLSSPTRGESSGRERRPQLVQQALGVERVAGEDHVAAVNVRRRAGCPYVVCVRDSRRRPDDVDDGRQRVHNRAGTLSEVQVVLDQRVLGVVAAPGHAGAAVDAGVAGGTRAAEERIGDLGAGLLAEQHADVCGWNVSPAP